MSEFEPDETTTPCGICWRNENLTPEQRNEPANAITGSIKRCPEHLAAHERMSALLGLVRPGKVELFDAGGRPTIVPAPAPPESWPTDFAWMLLKVGTRYTAALGIERGRWPVTFMGRLEDVAHWLPHGETDRRAFRVTVTIEAELDMRPPPDPASLLFEKGAENGTDDAG